MSVVCAVSYFGFCFCRIVSTTPSISSFGSKRKRSLLSNVESESSTIQSDADPLSFELSDDIIGVLGEYMESESFSSAAS